MKNGNSRDGRGRPRSFDTEAALDRALQVFWEKGYEGASLSDLTAAMGINRPSLYAAFGHKRALFSKVLDRYVAESRCRLQEALHEPTARAFAERLLRGGATSMCSSGNPRGCLLVQGALACGEAADSVRSELISRRHADEVTIRSRLKRAKEEGDLPPDSDPNALAQYLTTVLHGMAVEAASGASPAKLQRVADLALRAWPES